MEDSKSFKTLVGVFSVVLLSLAIFYTLDSQSSENEMNKGIVCTEDFQVGSTYKVNGKAWKLKELNEDSSEYSDDYNTLNLEFSK